MMGSLAAWATAVGVVRRDAAGQHPPGQRPVHGAGVQVAEAQGAGRAAGGARFTRGRWAVDGDDDSVACCCAVTPAEILTLARLPAYRPSGVRQHGNQRPGGRPAGPKARPRRPAAPGECSIPTSSMLTPGRGGHREQPRQLTGLVADDHLDGGERAGGTTALAGDPGHARPALVQQLGQLLVAGPVGLAGVAARPARARAASARSAATAASTSATGAGVGGQDLRPQAGVADRDPGRVAQALTGQAGGPPAAPRPAPAGRPWPRRPRAGHARPARPSGRGWPRR